MGFMLALCLSLAPLDGTWKHTLKRSTFHSQTDAKQFLWNGCYCTTNRPSITYNINKIIMQSSGFSSWLIILSFVLDIEKNQFLLLILKCIPHQVFIGTSNSLCILVPDGNMLHLYLFIHSFSHLFTHIPKRHPLVRTMILWAWYQLLYNLLNTKKLLCVSHHPRFHESKNHPV